MEEEENRTKWRLKEKMNERNGGREQKKKM